MSEVKTGGVFNLKALDQGVARKLMEGISTRVFCGEKVMLSIVTLQPNITGRMHSHPEEQWGLMLEGEGVRIQDGREYTVKPGDFWYTPCNAIHGMRTGDKGAVVLDIFGPPRDVYREPGEGYGAVT